MRISCDGVSVCLIRQQHDQSSQRDINRRIICEGFSCCEWWN